MDHLAIMNPKWGLIEKILAKEKQIESRWYSTRRAPWNKIATEDLVYFKNAGRKVVLRATVTKVLQFENLNTTTVKKIIRNYGGRGKIALRNKSRSYKLYRNKKYCILIFLKGPQKITPFNIDKTGFGIGTAWITVSKISTIKK